MRKLSRCESCFATHGFPVSEVILRLSACGISEKSDRMIFFAGSPLGAGTLAGGDGSRQPSALELGIAKNQGESFTKILSRVTKKVESSE